jgi:hypothetical protein
MKTLKVGQKYYDKIRNITVEVKAIAPEAAFPYATIISGSNEWWIYTAEEAEKLLTEVLPYDDFKIDEPVLVWMANHPERKVRRYFAGTNDRQLPLTWANGRTSWTAKGQTTAWDFCILASEFKEGS